MKTARRSYLKHWRDALAVLTVMLVMGSLVLIAYGLAQANHLAVQSKQFTACIAKDLATPLPAADKSRVITNLYTTCNIKFTQ